MLTKSRGAFSRFEVVIAVATLALLAFIAAPKFASAESQSRITACVEQLQRIERAFEYFNASNGYWPPDTVVGKLPPEMRSLFKDDNPFQGLTPIGGQYDYELFEDTGAICIVIKGSELIEPPTLDDAMALDAELDDGDLRTGNFRLVGDDFAYAFAKK